MTGPHNPGRPAWVDPGAMLPLDPDTDVNDVLVSGAGRPVHLRWRYIGLVAVGGAVGTASREAISLAIPPINGIPVAIFLINIVGALFLGALLESLARRGPDEGRRRTLRLLLGTGVAGGFTTYSAVATDTGLLILGDPPWTGIGYAIATVVVGVLVTLTGIGLASAHHNRRINRSTEGGDR